MTAANPLLDTAGLPRFHAITPEHVAPAITALLAEYRTVIAQVSTAEATWDAFVAPQVAISERLGRAWGIVGHLHAVQDSPAWREAYNQQLPEVSRFYAELGQNLALFEKYTALKASAAYDELPPARQAIVDHALRDFRLSGAALPDKDKPHFLAIQEELAALAAKFSENLLDATNAHAEWISNADHLTGLPPDSVAAARAAAEAEGKPGWKFTLHAPSYLPVMQFANDPGLRQRMYRAYATRASEFGPASWDNGPVMARMLVLQREAAQLLGFANAAHWSLASKMADTPAQVVTFLRDLAARARPFAENDLEEVRSFAREQLGLSELAPWDLAWASEKLKEARYAFSDAEIKPYFPEAAVLAGLFHLIESLFALKVLPEADPSVWHPDVRLFRMERNGALVGKFYLDLYARPSKRGGAWMQETINRQRHSNALECPVAYLNCNFSAPVNGRPATFTHDDVLTLFHETGHGLHHLLTEVDDPWINGIHGVEWDAVELPSQFLENFAWEWEVLQHMTRHIDTQATLPRSLYDKMLAARNFQSGLFMLRQIEFALFDMLLYSTLNDIDERGQSVLALLHAVRKEVAVIFPPEWHRFPQSFSHIFGGGYAAGYYSYKWAEVLSADAYAAFEEAAALHGNILDAATGARFQKEILAVGGARPAMQSFIAFRGREPTPDALLRHNGMVSG